MKANKKLDKVVELMFYKLANGIQFNIMDLGKVANAAKKILLAGGELENAEAAMQVAIAQYRMN
jgi:hypothetical protein